ncbi:MAG: Thioredoxin family protein [uncultured Sulfurovum sp.]|uniref:Thioredoxin family protein n=1 Tax=uncultured Sulfurovum sp. TaxID=269237 RepID=A0A6S6SUU3_9BACT|nr:MAG: Thioredoxin family protein [uncultured Sulfurovum sp.]
MLMAYNTGDTIDTTIVEKLELEEDKLYVIDFFASWCKSCKKELPLISKVHQDKVVEVVGVNVDDSASKGKDFVNKLDLPFSIYYDSDKTVISKFDPVGVPALYYVKNGKVLGLHIGAVKEIDKKITKEVKEL